MNRLGLRYLKVIKMRGRTHIFFEGIMHNLHFGKYLLKMTVGLDSASIGPEKYRTEDIIDLEEVMMEIDDIVLLFQDFADSVAVVGFPLLNAYRCASWVSRIESWYPSIPCTF